MAQKPKAWTQIRFTISRYDMQARSGPAEEQRKKKNPISQIKQIVAIIQAESQK